MFRPPRIYAQIDSNFLCTLILWLIALLFTAGALFILGSALDSHLLEMKQAKKFENQDWCETLKTILNCTMLACKINVSDVDITTQACHNTPPINDCTIGECNSAMQTINQTLHPKNVIGLWSIMSAVNSPIVLIALHRLIFQFKESYRKPQNPTRETIHTEPTLPTTEEETATETQALIPSPRNAIVIRAIPPQPENIPPNIIALVSTRPGGDELEFPA